MSRATRSVRGPGRTAPARRTVMLACVAAVAALAAMVPAAALAAGGGRAHRAPANRPDRHSLAVPGVADTFNNRIRVVAASTGTFYGQAMTAGDIYTVAGAGGGFSGDGGPATAAHMTSPMGVVADSAGNVVIAASGNRRVRVVAASTGSFYGVTMTKGNIYTVAGSAISGLSGDGGPATKAGLGRPVGVATDANGNLLIADPGTDRIRLVSG